MYWNILKCEGSPEGLLLLTTTHPYAHVRRNNLSKTGSSKGQGQILPKPNSTLTFSLTVTIFSRKMLVAI